MQNTCMFKTLNHAVNACVIKSIEQNIKSIYERENNLWKTNYPKFKSKYVIKCLKNLKI